MIRITYTVRAAGDDVEIVTSSGPDDPRPHVNRFPAARLPVWRKFYADLHRRTARACYADALAAIDRFQREVKR
jgi:hypothetical protein